MSDSEKAPENYGVIEKKPVVNDTPAADADGQVDKVKRATT
jgi:hypothetical protein